MQPSLRAMLVLWLAAVVWGGGLLALLWIAPQQPWAATVAWVCGMALLLLLALSLGVWLRVEWMQRQSSSSAAPRQEPAGGSGLQLAALQRALAAERERRQHWQQAAAQAQQAQAHWQQRLGSATQALLALQPRLQAVLQGLSSLPPAQDDAATTALSDSAQALSAQWRTLAADLAAQADLAQQQRAWGDALARFAADQEQAAAHWQRRSQQLAQTAADVQLLGLNLRLQLSHLAQTAAVDATTLEQTAADLDALLGVLDAPAAEVAGQTGAMPPQPPAVVAAQQTAAQALLRVQRIDAALASWAEQATAQQSRCAEWQRQIRQQQQALAAVLQSLHALQSDWQRPVEKNS
jgi:hypothetical protein